MDDFERALREGLNAEVGEWTPTPGEVRRVATAPASRRRLQVSLALAAVFLVAAGGIGIAVGVSGGHKSGPATLAAAPSPSESLASPSSVESEAESQAACQAELQADDEVRRAQLAALAATGASPSPIPFRGGVIPCDTTVPAPGQSCVPVSADCTDVGLASPAVSPSEPAPTVSVSAPATATVTATAVPVSSTSSSPTRTVVTLPPQCTSADLHLSLSTDHTTYVQTNPVAITVSSTSTATCQANEPQVSIQPVYAGGGLGDGHFTWVTCHGHAPLPTTSCASDLEIFTRHPGETKGASYNWDMVTAAAAGTTPAQWASAGFGTAGQNYLITYSWGAVKATKMITIVTPPACTSDQLTPTITADAASYTQGQVAHFTGTIVNTSQQLCGTAPYVQEPTITDSSGEVIWSCGDPSGLSQDEPCAIPAIAFSPEPLLPGAALATRHGTDSDFTTAPLSFSWNLVHDGTKDAGPGPVPDGNYTLGWTGVGIGASAPVAITVTG